MHDTPTPFIVIPYFDGDDGHRPIDPNKATSWMCTSILLNGAPYTGAIDPTKPVNLAVKVANWGFYAAMPVQVRLFWCDPSAGVSGAQMQPIGAVVLPFLDAGQEQMIPIVQGWNPSTVVPPMPAHSCLFAEAGVPAAPPVPPGSPPSPPADPANGSFDVVNDRHYGQQNLILQTVKAGADSMARFAVGNPTGATRKVQVRAAVLQGDALSRVARALGLQPAAAQPPLQVSLVPLGGAGAGANAQGFNVDVGPNAHITSEIRITVPAHVLSKHVFAVEIQQVQLVAEKPTVLGTQGIVIVTA